jgi:acetyl-CoA carboxylase carboxyl transferase subunit alpha
MEVVALLDFEKPISELEGKVKELHHLAKGSDIDLADEIEKLEERADKLLRQTYAKLSPWQKTQVARHPERPHFVHYIKALFDDFTPLAGDRTYGDDKAILGGPARFRGRSVMVIGHEKGDDTADRVRHNFGMANPEGYRKAVRLMQLAERFKLPVITLIDTPGAYPGLGAEERGQAEAIARAIEACLQLTVPLVGVVIGEGGSGGAIALATADRVLMLEHAVYSVISPEGCAAILWRNGEEAPAAAEAMRLTAKDLEELGVVDEIVEEPVGGAHRSPMDAITTVGDAIDRALTPLLALDGKEVRHHRRRKFLEMGTSKAS